LFDMKLTKNVLVLSVAAGIFGLAIYKRTAAQAPTAQGPRQPVVVELFTSEGCSSCPPADQLLAKLETEQPVGNAEILALEEHVDYWNQGGWVDPFSSDSATIRQYAYGEALGNGNAFTPQMVVDGQSEFVGSREGQARSAIEQAGSRKKTEVTVTADGSGKNGAPTLHIKVGALQNATGSDAPEVWMAITETGLHSSVKGGENAGEELRHAAVVRKLQKIGAVKNSGDTSFSAEQPLKLNSGWKREHTRVVVFVQERKSKKILGAGSTTLPG
jgi:hypothetical protein